MTASCFYAEQIIPTLMTTVHNALALTYSPVPCSARAPDDDRQLHSWAAHMLREYHPFYTYITLALTYSPLPCSARAPDNDCQLLPIITLQHSIHWTTPLLQLIATQP
jgi:hypothetical protein